MRSFFIDCKMGGCVGCEDHHRDDAGWREIAGCGRTTNFSARIWSKLFSRWCLWELHKEILLQRSFFCVMWDVGRNRRLLRVLDWFAKEDHYQMRINKIEIKLLVNNKKLIEHFQVSVEIVVWVNIHFFQADIFFGIEFFKKNWIVGG